MNFEQKQDALNQKIVALKASPVVTREMIREILLLVIDLLMDGIDNKKVDDLLEDIKDFIEEDKFNIFQSVHAALRISILNRQTKKID